MHTILKLNRTGMASLTITLLPFTPQPPHRYCFFRKALGTFGSLPSNSSIQTKSPIRKCGRKQNLSHCSNNSFSILPTGSNVSIRNSVLLQFHPKCPVPCRAGSRLTAEGRQTIDGVNYHCLTHKQTSYNLGPRSSWSTLLYSVYDEMTG